MLPLELLAPLGLHLHILPLACCVLEELHEGSRTRRDPPGSHGETTIVLEHGEWRFHDNYFGGEPYGGREVVFLGGQPVWMAVYYGHVDDANVDTVYSFLPRALREAPPEFPVRGPQAFSEGQFSYRNAYAGDVMRFWGQETIHADGRLVYTARYGGGRVNRRSGD